MANINLEDLDNGPISFDLSEEDIDAIKGGTFGVYPIYPIYPIWPFPIRIFIVRIYPAPIDTNV